MCVLVILCKSLQFRQDDSEKEDSEDSEEELILNPDLEVLEDEVGIGGEPEEAGSICQSISKGIFVLTPALIIILALRNSLQW